MSEPKIVIFDLEIIPDLKQALKYWTQLSQFYGKTLKANVTSILCAGWKLHGQPETHCINAWDYSRWKKDINDDYTVCKEIYNVLKNADAVVTHNGKRFDWKYLQTRLIINGFPPLPRIQHIDTCQLAKSNLYMINNKLGTIGREFVMDDKLDNGGWDLWVRCHNKEQEALDTMELYCLQDVDLLEKVFEIMKPFVKNLPNRNLYRTQKDFDEGNVVCPTCGSKEIKRWGYVYTRLHKKQRIMCKSCNSHACLTLTDKNPRAV